VVPEFELELEYNNPMQIIDSHCHLDVVDFDADRDAVLADCRALGVSRIVVPGVVASGWDNLLQVCRQQTGLYPALGLHPVYLDEHGVDDLKLLEQRLADVDDVVAVGEIGLDFFIADLDRQRQITLFEAQLAIAVNADLPVILHVRKAHDQVIAILKRFRPRGGIVHAFNGSLEQAQQYIDLGFKLGFGGMLTYDRASKLRGLAKQLPLETMVLETDAPDMSGQPCHGQRNSPQYLPQYLEALAELRGESVGQVAAVTTENVMTVLALK